MSLTFIADNDRLEGGKVHDSLIKKKKEFHFHENTNESMTLNK